MMLICSGRYSIDNPKKTQSIVNCDMVLQSNTFDLMPVVEIILNDGFSFHFDLVFISDGH